MHLKSTEFNEILKDILKHPYKKESDIYILNTYLKSLKKFMNIIQSENTHYDIEDLLSKISSKFSAATPKQNACIYNQIYGGGVEKGNILIKKNLKLADLQKLKNSRNNMNKNNKNLSKN